MIPLALSEALNTLQQKKESAENALVTKSAAANALAKAKNEAAQMVADAEMTDEAAATDLAAKAVELDDQRRRVEAIEDSYYTVGGTIPENVN